MRPSPCLDGRGARATAAAVTVALATLPALAHDTWLAWRPGAAPGQVWLALGTGEAYPQHSSPIERADLHTAACRSADGRPWPLHAQRMQGPALWLQARLPADTPPDQALSCWAETRPRTLTLSAAEVQAYLHEIRAPAELQARWAADARAGATWTEQYSKHARIELQGGHAGAPRQSAGLALDIVIESAAPAVGQELVVRVLRDGVGLPGQALQLLGEQAARGVWLQTDAQGRARVSLPLAGRWLLRGTDLHPPEKPGAPWRSRFVTLAFEVPGP